MHPYLGSSSDAEEMLRQYSDGGDSSIRQLSSLVTVMKREYNQVIMAKHLTFSVWEILTTAILGWLLLIPILSEWFRLFPEIHWNSQVFSLVKWI